VAEKKVKLNSGGSLQAFLSEIVAEGVKSALAQKALTEKEKQAATAGAQQPGGDGGSDDLFGGAGGDEEGGDEGGEDDNSTSKTMDDETEKLAKGEVKTKDVVDKLNSIRSGKSFKDSAVSKAMEDYIDSLAKPEKVALLAFLKGIAQIVTGEVSGANAEEPSGAAPDVQMSKGDKKDVKHVKPNVIKGGKKSAGAPGGEEQPPQEDTSSPAPITPKKR
jgi:hypothetical protein